MHTFSNTRTDIWTKILFKNKNIKKGTAILLPPGKDGKSQMLHQNKNSGLWKQTRLDAKLQYKI